MCAAIQLLLSPPPLISQLPPSQSDLLRTPDREHQGKQAKRDSQANEHDYHVWRDRHLIYCPRRYRVRCDLGLPPFGRGRRQKLGMAAEPCWLVGGGSAGEGGGGGFGGGEVAEPGAERMDGGGARRGRGDHQDALHACLGVPVKQGHQEALL